MNQQVLVEIVVNNVVENNNIMANSAGASFPPFVTQTPQLRNTTIIRITNGNPPIMQITTSQDFNHAGVIPPSTLPPFLTSPVLGPQDLNLAGPQAPLANFFTPPVLDFTTAPLQMWPLPASAYLSFQPGQFPASSLTLSQSVQYQVPPIQPPMSSFPLFQPARIHTPPLFEGALAAQVQEELETTGIIRGFLMGDTAGNLVYESVPLVPQILNRRRNVED